MMFSVSQILILKKHLEDLRRRGLVKEWGISYENGINKFVDAHLYFRAADNLRVAEVCQELQTHKIGDCLLPGDGNIPEQHFRIEFNSKAMF